MIPSQEETPSQEEIPTIIDPKDYQYISWISTVSGRLFFHLTNGYNYRNDRIVGDVLHYNEKLHYDNKSSDHRVFLISMLVDLRDLAEKGKSKYTRAIILAQTLTTDSVKALQGDVYFIDDQDHAGLYKSQDEVDLLQEISELIQDKKPPSYDMLNLSIKGYIEKLKEEGKDTKEKSPISIDKIEFTLRETGIIFLKKEDKKDNQNEVDPDIKAAFHILKFTFHKDRFHQVSAEEIIRIVPVSDGKEKIANKLVTGVKRHITEIRKNKNNPPFLQNLKGVIDYAQTLITVLAKEGFFSNDTQPVQEKSLLDKVDKSIDKELETKPYHPATIYRFISEIQSIAVMSLAVLAPFLIIYSKDFNSGKDFIYLIFISSYTCLFLGMLVVMFLFNMAYNRSMKATYIGKNIDRFLKELNTIKRWSNPNVSSKINIFSKYIIPWMINIEMLIRRQSKHIKAVLLALLSIGVFYFFFIWIPENNLKEQSINRCSPFKPVPANVLKDNNETYLIIKENIAPLILELKKIRENVSIVRENSYQKNDTARIIELNTTLSNMVEELKSFKQEYKNKTIKTEEKTVEEKTDIYSLREITDFLKYEFHNGHFYKNSLVTQVDELQYFLESLGLKIDPKEKKDKYFGDSTRKAVLEFQKMTKVSQDGVVGSKTRKIINTYIYLSKLTHTK